MAFKKLKKLTPEQEDDISAIIDNEGFWYALSTGGYLKPEQILDDEEDIKKVKEAIDLIERFEAVCPSVV